jgi:hypothetical protein
MRKGRKWLGILLTVLLVGGIYAGTAFAGNDQQGSARGQKLEQRLQNCQHRTYSDSCFSAVAEVLGMEPQELKDALRDGKSLKDLIAEKGITVELAREQVLSVQKEKLDQAVKEGKLTQEQADGIYQRRAECMQSDHWLQCQKHDQHRYRYQRNRQGNL